MAAEYVSENDWLIEAGKLEPGKGLRIRDGDTAYSRERIADMQAALNVQYKDRNLEAWWHGRYGVWRKMA